MQKSRDGLRDWSSPKLAHGPLSLAYIGTQGLAMPDMPRYDSPEVDNTSQGLHIQTMWSFVAGSCGVLFRRYRFHITDLMLEAIEFMIIELRCRDSI